MKIEDEQNELYIDADGAVASGGEGFDPLHQRS